ncbi:MAG: response regulator, partial [Elainellaceae cyanobacterium]
KDLVETVYGIGYRLKPLEEAEAAAAALSHQRSTASVHMPTTSEITAAVATAWEVYKGEMHERLSVLESVAAAIANGQLSPDLQHAGRSQAHKLAGSLGCFGFPEGSRLARQLEHLLQLDTPLDYQQSSHISSTVQQLRQQVAINVHHSDTPAAIATPHQSNTSPLANATSHIWVVGAAEPFSDGFQTEASAAGFHSVAIASLDLAHDRLQTETPAALLLWSTEENFDASMAVLKTACSSAEHGAQLTPVLVLTDIQDFRQRLQMVQWGASRLLSTAMQPASVMEAVQQVQRAGRAEIKVVLLDDDTHVLALLQTILLPWGFQITTLDNPTRLPQILAAVQPDLLVLDIEMPEANGLEICQVLRADEQWWQLPILFLTVHDDISMQQQAFSVGADDFVRKSTMARNLPMRILNRLKR